MDSEVFKKRNCNAKLFMRNGGEYLQYAIANGMTKCVVDSFEPVQIDDKYGTGSAGPMAPLQRSIAGIEKSTAIG